MGKLKWKILIGISVFILINFITTIPSLGNENDDSSQDYSEEINKIWDSLNLDSIDRSLERITAGKQVSFNQLSEEIFAGDFKGAFTVIKTAFLNTVYSEIAANKELMLQLIFIVLIGVVFANLSGSLGNNFVSENGFFITYLIISSIIFSSFNIALDIVFAALSEMITVSKVLIPIYLIALNFTGARFSATALYQVMLVCIWIVEVVIKSLLLPAIKFYVAIALVNNINKEDLFSKMADLVKQVIGWSLKTIIGLIIGVNIIKTMIAPTMDTYNRNSVSRIISALPGGSMASALFGTFLGAGKLIKNSIGVAGIIIILLVMIVPVLKVFILMVMIKLVSALVQPVGEKRYTSVIGVLSEGARLLLFALCTAVVMFMLSIAVIASSG